jgi:hypothetical protein
MAEWSLLTNHARTLLCIAHDPESRLRDISARLEITEHRAFGIVSNARAARSLTPAGGLRRTRWPGSPRPPSCGRDVRGRGGDEQEEHERVG